MINPQIAMVTGFSRTALSDVRTATVKPTSRSRSKGNEMTLMLSTTTAKTKPIAVPSSDQFPALWCAEDIADEPREGLRRRGAKERHVKRLSREFPADEDHQQQ